MISKHKLDNFNPKFLVVGCFIEHDGKILLVKRHKAKESGDKWSCPSGKVDSGETEIEAIIREVFEETGITDFSVEIIKGIYVESFNKAFKV